MQVGGLITPPCLFPEQAGPHPHPLCDPGAERSYTEPSLAGLTQHPGDTYSLTRYTAGTLVPTHTLWSLHAIHTHVCVTL